MLPKQIAEGKETNTAQQGEITSLFLKDVTGFPEVKMVLEISFKISGYHQEKRYVNN